MYRWSKNHKCEQPQVLAFIDAETYFQEPIKDGSLGRHTLRLGCATIGNWNGASLNGIEQFTFTDPMDFWMRLKDRVRTKKVAWLFAHNIMFDLWIMRWPEMVEIGQSLLTRSDLHKPDGDEGETEPKNKWRGMCSIDRGATIIHTITLGRRVNMVDSLNYYRCSVQELGASIGLPKLTMPDQSAEYTEWETYCRRDVDIIAEAITSLMREWRISDLGNWQPTAPALAFSSYRHKFMDQPIRCHNDDIVSGLERLAYYDGRTQPFHIGDIEGPIYHLDVCSLYPSVMAGNAYPTEAECDEDGRPLILRGLAVDDASKIMQTNAVIASVDINTTIPDYPCRYSGRVLYPTGTFQTVLCTPELHDAIFTGHVRKINWLIMYKRSCIFDSWVYYWWRRRRMFKSAENPAAAEVCKVVMNSLAGKFGQKQRRWINDTDVPVADPWSSWVHIDVDSGRIKKCRSIGWTAQTLIDMGDSAHSLVAVAAHVASYARSYMREIMDHIRCENVYYIGNDSLMVSQTGYDSLCELGCVADGELGKLRLCGVYPRIDIHGARDYEYDGKYVKSGIPRMAKRIGKRKWQADLIEDAESAISRPQDGSVHTTRVVITGSTYDPYLIVSDRGIVCPPEMRDGELYKRQDCKLE